MYSFIYEFLGPGTGTSKDTLANESYIVPVLKDLTVEEVERC